MKVLHSIHSLDPTHGGTSYGLRGMVEGLMNQGGETEVLVLDDAASPWLADWPCKVHAAGRGRGGYGFNRRFDESLRQLVKGFDHVVVHGLWQYHGLATRRACVAARIPYSVFPHGMLDRWFAAAYVRKHLVKQLYWWVAEYRLLRDAAAVFFTTKAEFDAGRDTFFPFAVRMAVAPFGIQPPAGQPEQYRTDFHRRVPGLADKRCLLFLGRLHPKKGCDLLIEGFARWMASLPPESRVVWRLRMVGPCESESYLQHLKAVAAAHDLNRDGLVEFVGTVDGDAKWQEIAQADALVLPSHQENFGVIIAEALACGVPVLISTKVNGWQAIESDRAALVEEDTVDGVIRLLQRWQSLDTETVDAMRRSAKSFFSTSMSAEVGARAFLRALENLRG